MSKRKLIASTIERVLEHEAAKSPRVGFFSTLDELVRRAPFERAAEDQWRGYLKPGRMLRREGVEFPLRQEELDYALDPALGLHRATREHGVAAGHPDGPSITREGMAGLIRTTRPEFSLTVNSELPHTERLKLLERYTGRSDQDFTGSSPRFDAGPLQFGPYKNEDYARLWTTGLEKGEGEGYQARFEESATDYRPGAGMPERARHGHFGAANLAWSRVSRHETPQGRVRLVDEIQSDLHQDARDPSGSPREYMNPAQMEQLDELGARKNEAQQLAHDLLITERAATTRGLTDEAADAKAQRMSYLQHTEALDRQIKELEDSVDVPARGYWTQEDEARLAELDKEINDPEANGRRGIYGLMDTDPTRAQAMLTEHHTLESRRRNSEPDAPFKDTADYARLELRKQLLDAVDEDEDYLALARGATQVERYFSHDPTGRQARGTTHAYDVIYRGELDKLARRYGARVVDVPIESGPVKDFRSDQMREMGAEDLQDYMASADDAFGDDTEMFHNVMDEELGALAISPEAIAEARAQLTRYVANKKRLVDHFDMRNPEHRNPTPETDAMQESLEREFLNLHDTMEGLWKSHVEFRELHLDPGMDSPETDTFPAIELTPEVKERIRRVGVPLFSVAGGAASLEALDADDEAERQRFAKGGQVRRALTELREYADSLAPQRGMFSTLDELVQQAPFETAPAEQWAGYLKPGRMLKREGLEFPLKQEELDYALRGLLERPGEELHPNSPLAYMLEQDLDAGNLTKEQLLGAIRRRRPRFSLEMHDESFFGRSHTGGDEDVTRKPPRDVYERYTDPVLPMGRRRLRLDSAFYAPTDQENARLSHQSPGFSYQESVTNQSGLEWGPQHFNSDTLSHSRTSSHSTAAGERVRLVEEIQSDLHQAAAERVKHDDWTLDLTPEGQAEASQLFELEGRAGLTPEEVNQRMVEISERHGLQRRRGYQTPEAAATVRFMEDNYVDEADYARDHPDVTEEQAYAEYRRLRSLVPDAPFKDPADYGRLELRKQLLNAVNEGEDYLALTRGQDQIERYSMDPDDAVDDGSTPEQLERKAAGMRHVYDRVYRGELERLAKRYGAEVVDVPLEVSTGGDWRLSAMRDAGLENSDDLADSMGDGMWSNLGISEEESYYLGKDVFEELQAKYEGTELGDAPDRLSKQWYDVWQSVKSGDRSQEVRDLASTTLAEMQDLIDDTAANWDGKAQTLQKTFPAMRLTPEVRKRVKQVGVPLWSLAGGAAVLDSLEDEEEPVGYAKGGAVRRAMRELFDAKGGEGAVPNNQNVQYLGFETEIPASQFLRLAERLGPGDVRDDSVDHLKRTLREGDKLGIPFLEVRWRPEERRWQVEAHDGRHRAIAVQELHGEDAMIPVHVFPRGEMRARHITPEMRAAPFVPQDLRRTESPVLRDMGTEPLREPEEARAAFKPAPYGKGGSVKPTREDPDDAHRLLKRAEAMYREQWTGLDDEGEARGALYTDWDAPKEEWTWNGEAGMLLPPTKSVMPGIALDTMTLPLLLNDVQDLWNRGIGEETTDPLVESDYLDRASERLSGLDRSIRGEYGLDAPHGVAENAAEAFGIMGGQLAWPGGTAKKAPGLARRMLTAPLEFFSPVVEPRLGAYAAGTAFGGALGLPGEFGGDGEDASWRNYEDALMGQTLAGGAPYQRFRNELSGLPPPDEELDAQLRAIERHLRERGDAE